MKLEYSFSSLIMDSNLGTHPVGIRLAARYRYKGRRTLPCFPSGPCSMGKDSETSQGKFYAVLVVTNTADLRNRNLVALQSFVPSILSSILYRHNSLKLMATFSSNDI
jgi:hypothetical protein